MTSRGGARTGAGRPRSDRMTEVIHVRIAVSTANIMRRHAEFAGVSLSELAGTSIMYGEALAYKNLIEKQNTKIKKNKPG